MPVTKKKTTRTSTGKRAERKPVIITKSSSTKTSPFAKKIKAMNTLLGKAKLLSS
jgi:hypothetical protein